MATYLANNAQLVGLAILPKAKLYQIDWYPLVESDNVADEVIGDVFLLNDTGDWKCVDEYEGIGVGNPPYEYRRALATIKTEAVK
ncbi:MAG: hypothetical protein R2807_04515 [Chitinophagales bacterium]